MLVAADMTLLDRVFLLLLRLWPLLASDADRAPLCGGTMVLIGLSS